MPAARPVLTAAVTDQARLLAAVAEPTWLLIVRLLRSGPRTVGVVALALGVPVVNASHHLRLLSGAGVLLDRRHGRFIEYRLNPDVYRPPTKAGGGVLELAGLRLHLDG